MGTLCLCMIVRDEAEHIERCLASCRDVIDRWVICDTGSVDDTPARIERALAGVRGELHHHPWVDFAHNRTRMLELARGTADHLLFLDADCTLEAAPGALADLRADAYLVRHAGPSDLHRKSVVAGHLGWRYVGVTHEYITCPDERTCERLAGVEIHSHSVGGARGRWERDRELLEREPDDPRSVFYLAQTLRDLGQQSGAREQLALARATYERRAAMGGWDEEVYCALHEAGALAAALGDWPGAMALLVDAWERRPQRLEAVYDLVAGLRARDRHHTAHRFTVMARGPLPIPDDDLHVARWVYEWGMLFEYSISAYWVGDLDACVAACDALLARDDLFDGHREQTVRNRAYAIEAKAARIAATAPRT